MGATQNIRHEVLDKLLRGTAISTAQVTHMSLHDGDPGETGTNELSGGSYAREAISFDVAASDQSDNTSTVSFASLPTATVSYVGLWTAVSGGTFVWGGPMTANKSVEPGDTLEFAAGAVIAPTSGS